MTEPEPITLLSTPETARQLRLDAGTLATWRCRRRTGLPFVRIGRRIFYRQIDIDNFIARNMDSGIGPRPTQRELGRPCRKAEVAR
jgi:hypothetical protein